MSGDGWTETYNLYDALEATFPDILMNRAKAFAYLNSQFSDAAASGANSQSTLSQTSATGQENMFELEGGRRSRRGYKKQRGGAWTQEMLAALKTLLYLLFLHQFVVQGVAARAAGFAGEGAGAAATAVGEGIGGAFAATATLATRARDSANTFCSNPFSSAPIVAGGCSFALRAWTEAGTLLTTGGAQGPALSALLAGLVSLYAFLQASGFILAMPGQAWRAGAAVAARAAPAAAHARMVLGGVDGWVDALAQFILNRIFGPNAGVDASVQADLAGIVQRGPGGGDPDGPPGGPGGKGPGPAGAGAGTGATLGGRRRGRGRGRGRKTSKKTKKVMKRRRGTTRKY